MNNTVRGETMAVFLRLWIISACLSQNRMMNALRVAFFRAKNKFFFAISSIYKV